MSVSRPSPEIISPEALEALRAMRSPGEAPLPEGRLYNARRISTSVDSHAIPASRRSVDVSVGRRVSVTHALAVVTSLSQSTVSSSSPGEAGLSMRSGDADAPSVPSPLRKQKDSAATSSRETSVAVSTGRPTQQQQHQSLPFPYTPHPPQSVSSPVSAPPAAVAAASENRANGPSFAQKFKRRVDALGTLNESGAGLTLKTDTSSNGNAASDAPVTSQAASPVTHRAVDGPSQTTMQLFFAAEDDRTMVQRPGDFRRRVNVTAPSQWLNVDSSDDSTSDSDDA